MKPKPASLKRTAEGIFTGRNWRTNPPRPSPGDAGQRLVIMAPHHTSSIYVVNDRVDAIGTAPEYRRLIGLSVAALRAYAATKGWRVLDAPPRREVAP